MRGGRKAPRPSSARNRPAGGVRFPNRREPPGNSGGRHFTGIPRAACTPLAQVRRTILPGAWVGWQQCASRSSMPAARPPPRRPCDAGGRTGMRGARRCRVHHRRGTGRRVAASPGSCRRACSAPANRCRRPSPPARAARLSRCPSNLKISPPAKSVRFPSGPAHRQPVYAPPAPRQTAQSRPARPPRRVARTINPDERGGSREGTFIRTVKRIVDQLSSNDTRVRSSRAGQRLSTQVPLP